MSIVINFPDASKPLATAAREVVIATAERAVAFHEEVAVFHTREAEQPRDQLNRFKEGKTA
jgi:hypothetical protein